MPVSPEEENEAQQTHHGPESSHEIEEDMSGSEQTEEQQEHCGGRREKVIIGPREKQANTSKVDRHKQRR